LFLIFPFSQRDLQVVNISTIQQFIDMGRLTPKPNGLITMRDLIVAGVVGQVREGVKLLANVSYRTNFASRFLPVIEISNVIVLYSVILFIRLFIPRFLKLLSSPSFAMQRIIVYYLTTSNESNLHRAKMRSRRPSISKFPLLLQRPFKRSRAWAGP
jgi:hypothetical protein